MSAKDLIEVVTHVTFTLSEARAHTPFIIPIIDFPNRLAGRAKFTNIIPACKVPQLDPSIVTASDDEPIVELETSDTIIVGPESAETFECLQAVD